jgi:hypothetical protein
MLYAVMTHDRVAASALGKASEIWLRAIEIIVISMATIKPTSDVMKRVLRALDSA